jgi:hypothetical protein
LDDKKNLDEKPVGKNDHALDTLRYIIQELPDDPDQLINKSVNPMDIVIGGKSKSVTNHHAFSDNDDDIFNQDWYYNY